MRRVDLAWALVVPAYVLGTFPTAILVGRHAGVDPTTTGSRNPGATNTYRTAGRAAGALVLLGDLGKGALAAGAGWALGGRGVGVACALAAVLGHVAPVTRNWQGGKGVATAAGAFAVLHPLPAAVLAAAWVAIAAATRRASIASIGVVVCFPLAAAARDASAGEVVALALCATLVIVRHRDNIARLARGEEQTLRT